MLLQFIPLIPVILFFCLLAVRFWGLAIVGVLAWAMVEGAVRKWIFPGLQQPILLAKDVVLVFAYLGHMFLAKSKGEPAKSGALMLFLLIETAFCSLQVLNPRSPSTVMSLYGLKNYIIYLPLALIMTDVLRTRKQLKTFLLGICLMSVPISLLGLYQFSQPPASWINQYLNHEEGVENNTSTFGVSESEDGFSNGRVRTSSTFSYIGGFVTYLLLIVPLTAALLLAAVPKQQALLMTGAALILGLGGAATTGSRAPFFIFGLAAVILLSISVWKGMLSLPAMMRIAIGVVLLGGMTVWLSGSAFDALEYRAQNSDSASERVFSPFTETYRAFQESPIAGYGTGANSNASLAIMKTTDLWWLDGFIYESEPARVMQELGFVGFTIVYLPKIFAILLIFGYIRRSTSSLMLATHMSMLVFVFVHLFLVTVNNPTGGLMYFAAIGVAMAAHAIELRERQARTEQFYYEQQGFPLQHVALA